MILKILTFIFVFLFSATVNAQSLGSYSSATATAGKNKTVTPSSAPGNTTKIFVSTTSNFQGVLTGDPVTGKVTIVDARPAGVYTIKVKALSSAGSSTTKTFTLTVNNPDCSDGDFNGHGSTNTGLNQLNILVGDFNRDGKQDIAGVHEGGNNTLSIRLGNGNGTFSGTSELAVGSHPFHGAIADFNGDGDQDICIANSGAGHVSILLGTGTGTFITNPVVPVEKTPVCVAVGDFNNDAKQDIITANLNSGNVSVRLGDGAGYFSGSTKINVGIYPYYVAVGDFNGDGKLDFASASGGLNTISVRLGNGAGSFSGTTEVPVGLHPNCVAVGDFNKDGKQDLASANYASNTVSIRLGDGLGNFSGNTEVPVGSYPNFVAVGNFNGDDHVDIATANYFGNDVSIRFGDGTGGFVGTSQFSAGSYPTSLAVGDFNNDDLMDVAVSDYNDHAISIHLGVAGSHTIDPVTSNSPVCDGETVTLVAPGGDLHQWTGPNGFSAAGQTINISAAHVTDTGQYVVTLTDTAGCTGTASAMVMVNPLPEVSYALQDDSICMDSQSKLLVDGTPAGGTFSGTGVNGHLFNPHASGPGVFTVTYTYVDSNGCSNLAKDKMYVLVCTGMSIAGEEDGFNVYPNPFTVDFHIEVPVSISDGVLFLYSADGKLLHEWEINGKNDQVYDAGIESPGIYFLRLFSEKGVSVTRVIRQ